MHSPNDSYENRALVQEGDLNVQCHFRKLHLHEVLHIFKREWCAVGQENVPLRSHRTYHHHFEH